MDSATPESHAFPRAGDSQFLELDGGRLHYIERGRGDPLLMVHGNPTWSFFYRRLIDEFAPRYRCIAVDNMGCGLSDKPQSYRYRLDQHIENLLRLIERLDLQRITLVVHDWGGPIGLGAAVEQPERIARLVIMNTACFPPPYVPWRIHACRIPVLGGWMVRGLNLFCTGATRMATAQAGGLPAEDREGLLRPYDSWHNRVAVHRFVLDIPRGPHDPTWQRLVRIEQRMRLLADRPALIVWGMQDWCFRPECLRRIQKLLPDARSLEIPTAGHYVLQDAGPDCIAAIRSFLSSDDTSRS